MGQYIIFCSHTATSETCDHLLVSFKRSRLLSSRAIISVREEKVVY